MNRVFPQYFWLVISAYAVILAIVIGANPFVGQTSAPMDLLAKHPGWQGHEFSAEQLHPERTDVVDAVIPDWTVIKSSIRSGESGVWNSVSSNGRPGILDLSKSLLTPSFAAFLLIDDDWLGFYFAGLIKLLIAASGMFLFLRLFVGPPAAFVGGVFFALAGFHAAWFYWPHVATSAWIPWLLWACSGWISRGGWKYLSLATVTTVMLLLGGFPAVAAYGLYAAALLSAMYLLYQWSSFKETLAKGGLLFAAIVAGFMLAAIPLLALYEFLGLLDLGHRRGGTNLNFPDDLYLLLDPNAYGLPRVEKTFYMGKFAIIMAAISPVLLFFHQRNRTNIFLLLFGLVLLVVAVTVSFGLLPTDMIRSLPAIGTSPWNRLIILVDISIVILAVLAIDLLIKKIVKIEHRKLKILSVTLLSIVLLAQVLDQASLFKRFNNAVVKEDFFPDTGAINFVMNNISPLQSVVADRSFMLSGTLGAYGIPEWFAHGFYREEEKRVLSQIIQQPYRSPTAATFFMRDVNFHENELFSKLGIRYLMLNHNSSIRKQPHVNNAAAPHMPENSLSQVINLQHAEYIESIGLVLATFHAPKAPADVILELVDLTDNRVLSYSRLSANMIKDNRQAIFRFEQGGVELKPGKYKIRIKLHDNVKYNGRLTAWYSKQPKYSDEYLLVNGEVVYGAMLYTLYGHDEHEARINNGWQTVLTDHSISVVENKNVPNGAYFLPDLGLKSKIESSDVFSTRLDSTHVRIDYKGERTGYIVLPTRWFPGWFGYIDGEQVIPELYMNMLPAFKVTGPVTIKFFYQPTYLGKGTLLTLLGLMLLVGILYRATILQRKTKLRETE